MGGVIVVDKEGYCTYDVIVHKLGHALGLWHTMGRADRDDWLVYSGGNFQTVLGPLFWGINYDIQWGGGGPGPAGGGVWHTTYDSIDTSWELTEQ